MKNIWLKYKFLITTAIYAILVLAFVYYVVRPLVNDVRLRAYQAQAKAIDREIEKAQIDKLPEINKEWTDYESRKSVMNVILSQPDQVSFIESVESIAQTSGNKIELKIEDSTKNPSFGVKSKDILSKVTYPDYFPIEINLEGNYTGLVNFIHMLENGQFYVNVVAVSSVKNTADKNNNGNQNPFDSAPSQFSVNANDASKNVDDSIKTDISAIVYTQKQ